MRVSSTVDICEGEVDAGKSISIVAYSNNCTVSSTYTCVVALSSHCAVKIGEIFLNNKTTFKEGMPTKGVKFWLINV